MQAEILKKNLRLLKKYNVNLYNLLTGREVEPSGTVTFNSSGEPLLTASGPDGDEVIFHDVSEPSREADIFLNAVPEDAKGTVIFVGMGLGYSPLEMIRKRTHLRHLVIVEPRLEIFIQALGNMDLTDLLTRPGVLLLAGHNFDIGEALQPIVRTVWTEHTHVFRHVPSFRYHPDYERFKTEVFEFVNSCNIEGATNEKFGGIFFNNKLDILAQIVHQNLLESLDGLFKGVPAILVAGGPSLDKNINHLAEAKNRAVILAGDTVTHALLKKNISPDFITSADYRRITYEKFAATAYRLHGDSSLICVSGISPAVPRTFPARHVFWAFIQMFLDRWVCDAAGGKWLTGAVGTMAHLSLFSAIKMGCSPIVFIGQDLAYTDNRDHADSTVLTTRKRMKNQLETRQDLVWVMGQNGREVPTSRALYGHKAQFETIIAEHPGNYINASIGGAAIKGTENMHIRDVLETFCTTGLNVAAMTDKAVSRAVPVSRERIMSRLRGLEDDARSIKALLHKSDNLLKGGIKKMDSLEKGGKVFRTEAAMPAAIRKTVKGLDRYNSKIDGAAEIWNILEAVTFKDIRAIENKVREIEEYSREPGEFFNVVRKNFERIEIVNRSRMDGLCRLGEKVDEISKFLEQERAFEEQLEQDPSNITTLEGLGRLYLGTGHIVRAMEVYARLEEIEPGNREVILGKCVVAMFHHRFDDAWSLFATLDDPEGIEYFRKIASGFGKMYLNYATEDDRLDENASKRMLFRGINADRENPGLKELILKHLEADLKAISLSLEKEKFEEAAYLLSVWIPEVEENRGLNGAVPAPQLVELFSLKGRYEFLRGDYAVSVDYLEKACERTGDHAPCFIQLTEACFAKGDFAKGIAALVEAIKIDKEYAVYWEEIGDALFEGANYGDAVSAYENCFKAMPQRIHLLKKIGDCYQKTGELDSALEAYKQYKIAIKS